jgi:UDP:flavonoid glycosyltransferase YjiC (YdhE family)
MRIVFFNIPAHGHTNPTLGIVKELIKNNHEVYYYSYEVMREKIESSGAHFISCDNYDSQTMLTKEDKDKIAKDLADFLGIEKDSYGLVMLLDTSSASTVVMDMLGIQYR